MAWKFFNSSGQEIVATTATVPDGAVTNVKVATGIDAVKLADGSVTNAELQYINTLSSNAQTQITAKAPIAGATFTGTTQFATLSDGTIAVTAWVDEDNMSSNSATLIPTQQSVKAYVDAGGGGPEVLKKDADFSKANNTTFGNDDDFTLAVLANETWLIEYHLKLSGVTSGGLKWQFAIPTNATVSWHSIGWSDASPGVFIGTPMKTGDGALASGAASLSMAHAIVYARVVVGNYDGNVIPQWAQESSDSTATTIEAESYQVAQKE